MAMMAPDYAHWHGMYEVAERFYQELIPQAREIAEHAMEEGDEVAANAVLQVLLYAAMLQRSVRAALPS